MTKRMTELIPLKEILDCIDGIDFDSWNGGWPDNLQIRQEKLLTKYGKPRVIRQIIRWLAKEKIHPDQLALLKDWVESEDWKGLPLGIKWIRQLQAIKPMTLFKGD